MTNTFALDSAYLAKKRNEIKNDIAYAQYKVGGTWYHSSIQSAMVLASGQIEVTFLIDHTVSGNITVTGIELYDRNGARIGSRTVSITRADATEGISYVCRFGLSQIVESSDHTGIYDEM